jgi:ATP-dependent HslUV protease ATP-binding subunit HslU
VATIRPRRSTTERRAARERLNAAIDRVERHGIVLLDNVDRLTLHDAGEQPETGGEALQRALLPLLDGAEVVTDYGPVRTNHLLFVATGAFTTARVTDLTPEFAGRFPVRAELRSLDTEDFASILTAPERSLRDYYVQLLASDGVAIDFTQEGLREIAVLAAEANERGSDLGARRLVHVIEHLLAAVSFGEDPQLTACIIDAPYVREHCADLVEEDDTEQFIL